MLQKLQLDRTQNFERAIVVLEASRMLTGAICRSDTSHRSIGREQGIKGWDDIIIELHDGKLKHCQAKYQHSDFDTGDISENTNQTDTKPDEDQDKREVKALDSALKSLVTFFYSCDESCFYNKKFSLFLPSSKLNIKSKAKITIHHLETLCKDCANPTVSIQKLKDRALGTTSVHAKLYKWLSNDCGFKSWDDIFKVLANLEIVIVNNLRSLEAEAESVLRPYFGPEETAREVLSKFMDNTTSDVGCWTARILAKELEPYWRAENSRWTMYQKGIGMNQWTVSGVNDLRHGNVEAPISVVNALWTSQGTRILEVAGAWISSNEPLPAALARLALHHPNSGAVYFQNVHKWAEQISRQIGGTLGIADDHSDGVPEDWVDLPKVRSTMNKRLLEHRQERESLHLAMHEHVWTDIMRALEKKILDLSQTDIRDALENMYNHEIQTMKQSDRNELLLGLMKPKAEDPDIQADLRIGPRTLHLLKNGIFLLMVVSLLDQNGRSLRSLKSGHTLRGIALHQWSGSNSGSDKGKPRRLDKDVGDLLSKESEDIIILSGVKETPRNLICSSLYDDPEPKFTLMTPNGPKLLITDSSDVRRLLENTLENLRSKLKKRLDEYEGLKTRKSIKAAGGN